MTSFLIYASAAGSLITGAYAFLKYTAVGPDWRFIGASASLALLAAALVWGRS